MDEAGKAPEGSGKDVQTEKEVSDTTSSKELQAKLMSICPSPSFVNASSKKNEEDWVFVDVTEARLVSKKDMDEEDRMPESDGDSEKMKEDSFFQSATSAELYVRANRSSDIDSKVSKTEIFDDVSCELNGKLIFIIKTLSGENLSLCETLNEKDETICMLKEDIQCWRDKFTRLSVNAMSSPVSCNGCVSFNEILHENTALKSENLMLKLSNATLVENLAKLMLSRESRKEKRKSCVFSSQRACWHYRNLGHYLHDFPSRNRPGNGVHTNVKALVQEKVDTFPPNPRRGKLVWVQKI